MKGITYTGVGSRETPDDIQRIMECIGETLARAGWVLRSGHAIGADQAFERGCDAALGAKEIFVPWQGYEGSTSRFTMPELMAFEMIKDLHPKYYKLSDGGRRLQARNVHQVLGEKLNDPSAVVICWTPDGCKNDATRTPKTGGTGTTITLASRMNIPVFNLANEDDLRMLAVWLGDQGIPM